MLAPWLPAPTSDDVLDVLRGLEEGFARFTNAVIVTIRVARYHATGEQNYGYDQRLLKQAVVFREAFRTRLAMGVLTLLSLFVHATVARVGTPSQVTELFDGVFVRRIPATGIQRLVAYDQNAKVGEVSMAVVGLDSGIIPPFLIKMVVVSLVIVGAMAILHCISTLGTSHGRAVFGRRVRHEVIGTTALHRVILISKG